jgi:hypothetical protein
MAKTNANGRHHLLMGSLVFTAFSLEAYFNHVGLHLFAAWDDLESLNPKAKLNVISERLGFQVDYGHKPWQIMHDLFGFRNDIAHGKTKKISITKIEPLEKHNEFDWSFRAETRWEKYCTLGNAERARKHVTSIVQLIHNAVGFPGNYPFMVGAESGGSTLLPE